MHIKVMYNDGKYATVRPFKLGYLLKANMIKKFFRDSEHQWVIVGIDHIRENGHSYTGSERRK